jgi:hypothetical protein
MRLNVTNATAALPSFGSCPASKYIFSARQVTCFLVSAVSALYVVLIGHILCVSTLTNDKVKIIVIINNDKVINGESKNQDFPLDIYMPNWNVLTYNQGLCGIRYTK